MSDSDYAQPLPPSLHGNAAAGTQQSRPSDERWTTPTDLAKFAIGVERAYAGAEGALLPAELARQMLTPQIAASERIGGLNRLGLDVFLDESGTRYGHSGGNAGFRCHLMAYRDTGQGAVVMPSG